MRWYHRESVLCNTKGRIPQSQWWLKDQALKKMLPDHQKTGKKVTRFRVRNQPKKVVKNRGSAVFLKSGGSREAYSKYCVLVSQEKKP
jgi:hypothetical protein